MSDSRALSRRTVIGGTAALGIGLPLLGVGASSASAAPPDEDPAARAATRRAVSFLQQATDAYFTSGPRLVQSYQDNSGLQTVGFTYDNALTLMALLVAGDQRRARAIGDGILAVQEADGRLRQAYLTGQDPPVPAAGFTGTAVGDMSWAGVALAQLAEATGARRYLDGVLAIGRWIQRNAYSTTGLGGYTFGLTPGLEGFKSSEHNIDVYALFRLLYRLTGQARWLDRAEHAWDFVERMWNADAGFFYTGSNDGATVNTSPTQLPLDVQPWAWLAARQQRYAAALDWAATHLATTDTPLRKNSTITGNMAYTGVVFASGSLLTDTDVNIAGQSFNPKPDDGAVWFEGTAQLALALRDRRQGDDRDDAEELLDTIRVAQQRLGDGQTFGGKSSEGGIVAASSPMDTGFGFGYFPNRHTGATSWFVFAALNANPYRFF